MKSLVLIAASLPFIAASPAQSDAQAAAACRNLPGDSAWPSENDWKTQLPGSVARGPQKAKLHPDYRIDAKTVDDVIAAVKFAGMHNIRLSAIHSGHDGLGRNDAPSGLLLGLENLGGLRVEQTFTPTTQGMPKVGGAVPAAAAAPKAGGMAGMEGMAGMKRSPHGPDEDEMAAPATLTKASPTPSKATTGSMAGMAGMAGMKRTAHGPVDPKVATPPKAKSTPSASSGGMAAMAGMAGMKRYPHGPVDPKAAATSKASPKPSASSGSMAGMAGMAGMKRFAHGPDDDEAPMATPPKASTSPSSAAAPMAGMAGMAGMKRMPHGPDGDDEKPKAATAPKASTPPPATAPAAPVTGKAPYAVTIGAGLTTQEINDKIAAQGIFTNGAEHGEVGVAGGWTQCGGHGPMTSAYGLGSDNVLEFQVVTADGQLKIANEVANPDLYWALRGGCGSTFGIVTQATIRAYPSPKFTVTKFTLNATKEDYFEPLAYLHSVMPDLSDKGVQGYYLVFPNKFVGIFHTVGTLANADASKKIWEPVLSKMATYPGIQKESAVATYTDYPSYKTYYDATWGPAEGGKKKRDISDDTIIVDWWTGEYVKRSERNLRKRHGPGESVALPASMGKTLGDGRLMDKETLKSPKLASALKSAMPTKGMMRGALVGGGTVIKKSTTETSVHPSWRKTYVSIWSDKDVDELAALSPGMGAYINEASFNATNWQDVFWGSNYPKLSEIKTKYDPDMVFYATPGINADQMDANAKGALCRVQAQTKSLYPPQGDNKNMKGGKKM